jgi:hypothetical protein
MLVRPTCIEHICREIFITSAISEIFTIRVAGRWDLGCLISKLTLFALIVGRFFCPKKAAPSSRR